MEGALREREEREFFTIYQVYGEEERRDRRDFLTEAALLQDVPLLGILHLQPREQLPHRVHQIGGADGFPRQEFSFEDVDMGNVYHAVLERFAGKLKDEGYTWFDFPQEFAESGVQEALERYAADYGSTVLYSSARNEYTMPGVPFTTPFMRSCFPISSSISSSVSSTGVSTAGSSMR